jgi:RNA recognition motif-containing protein
MSTRIIVKNLPHNITPSRLKSHFSSSQSGTASFSASVTDAKLVTDPKSGRSRGFAFVGYRTQDEAQKAVEWFNDTFVDMRKISVEIAKAVFPLLFFKADGRRVMRVSVNLGGRRIESILLGRRRRMPQKRRSLRRIGNGSEMSVRMKRRRPRCMS